MAKIDIYPAHTFNDDEWRNLQALQRDAYGSILERSAEEIDTLVDWHDPARFALSHADPNSEVGRRFNDGQQYHHPRVTIATVNGELAGFGYAAGNVSGDDERTRQRKRLTILRDYQWLREVAVAPSHQRKGIAMKIGDALLKDINPLRPVTAYAWSEDEPFLYEKLHQLGFQPTGEQVVHLFGDHKPPVKQVRMQAKTVYGVRSALAA